MCLAQLFDRQHRSFTIQASGHTSEKERHRQESGHLISSLSRSHARATGWVLQHCLSFVSICQSRFHINNHFEMGKIKAASFPASRPPLAVSSVCARGAALSGTYARTRARSRTQRNGTRCHYKANNKTSEANINQ